MRAATRSPRPNSGVSSSERWQGCGRLRHLSRQEYRAQPEPSARALDVSRAERTGGPSTTLKKMGSLENFVPELCTRGALYRR